MSDLKVTESSTIPGLFEIELVVHADDRGSFREAYQAAKMEELGLPKLNVVQQNISFNKEVGVTRGIHAEPWDKYVTVAYGESFGAWIDLRAGDNFGAVHTATISTSKAFFIPKGTGNSYQTTQPNTTYSYLVTDHWSPDGQYVAVNLKDPKLNIDWPTSLETAIISEKDLKNPPLSEVKPMEF